MNQCFSSSFFRTPRYLPNPGASLLASPRGSMPEPGCGPSRAPRLRQELRNCAGSAGQKISVGVGRGHESLSCFETRLFLPGFAVLFCFVWFVLVVVGLLGSFDAGTEPASHRLTTKRMIMIFQGAMTMARLGDAYWPFW